MILTFMAVTPLVGALALVLMPRAQESTRLVKSVAVAFTLVTLVISLAMMAGYEVGAGGYQLTEQHTWIAQFGVSYSCLLYTSPSPRDRS